MKKTISQCMIVKNEEKNIRRALSWGKDIMCEQIVVDTGSSDRTVEIAREMGAKIFFFPWINDFAAAKNFAIDQAKGDWIAFLDADESFTPEDTKKIPEILEYVGDDVDGLLTGIVDLDENNNITSGGTMIRFFVNRPDLRYVGKIHEHLVRKGRSGLHLTDATKQLAFLHTGYQEQEKRDKSKFERNLNIILEILKQEPENCDYLGYLGDTYSSDGKNEEARDAYKKAVAAMPEKLGVYDQRSSYTYTNLLRVSQCLNAPEAEVEAIYKEAVEKLGRDRVYIDYIKKLAQFLLDNGRRPMFWGDIILGFPEMIKELPKEIICLNWGYMWNQREEETKWMYEAGAVQYCCPGCCGWNEFSALNWYAYNNIMRLCTYANKYGAIGLLNTDWGDYLHVNHPDFTRVGMIYGAAFSWNSNIPSYEDINRQISRIEYRDSSENYLAVVAKIQENSGYDWNVAVRYWEMKRGLHEQDEVSVGLMKERIGQMDNIDQKDANLKEIARELYAQIEQMDSSKRALVMPQIVAVDAIRIFNQIGKFATADVLGCTYESMPDSWALAKELETWFYFYKRVYRSISEESELRYIQELVCWYGDYLRQIK